jgi:bacillopeptidase F (M6 metalloprotease family)
MKTNARILLLGVITAALSILGVARAETVVWSENFDDKLANNRWAVDNGTWQIGSPTYGPSPNASGSRAYSGTNCVTTGLNRNYGDNVNSRVYLLAGQAFTVPSANQNPHLRFWHWFSSQAGADYGYVEVKTVGSSTWTTISSNYSGTCSGVWTRPSLDLSQFAGQTVQLAFHFISDGCCTEGPGWYVDDIAVVTGAPVFNNPEGFESESGLVDWYVDNGTWQIGKPTSGPGAAYDGTNCAATVLGGNYDNSVDSRLISAAFSIPPTNQNPRLRYWHWFSSQAGSDFGFVEVRPVGSNTWTAIADYSGTCSGVWTRPSLDMSQFAGQTVQVAFHFISDGCCTVGPGWYVDDIVLVTGTPVFNNPEGFEFGLGDWTEDNGTWQVGKPTSGPGAAYDGTNCAATVLGGNYDNSVDSRLISPPFTVPPANQSPLVRFWHWFSTQLGADIGVVEIKPVGSNTWTAISSGYSGSSTSWTQPALDISQFGGQTVQLAFHFTSDGCCTVGPGWYVDDVHIYPYIVTNNIPPVLSAIPNTNILETVPWQYTPTVSGSGYTFGLSNKPSGMTVNSSSGLISWTPTEAQGPSTNGPITYAVYQSGSTVAWTNFTVVVLESNLPPVFTNTPGTQTVYATTTMNVSDGATDPDIPANTLTYAIVSALSPSGVTINPNTGLVTWTPTTGQVGTSTIYVSVTDYNPWAVNSQQLSVTNSFSVIVKGLTAPSFTQTPASQVINSGQGFTFTSQATGFPTPTYQWQFSSNGVAYVNINGATGANYQLGSSCMTNIGYYRVLAANSVNTNSATVSLTFLNLNMYAGLNILGPLNANYNIQSTANLASNWTTLTNVSLPTQPYVYIDYSSPTNSKQFYRANPQ